MQMQNTICEDEERESHSQLLLDNHIYARRRGVCAVDAIFVDLISLFAD